MKEKTPKLCKSGKPKGPWPRGESHGAWKGGRYQRKGYITVAVYRGERRRLIQEHRIVMERHLGRRLSPAEVVHHINGQKDDNRLENLMLFSSQAEHIQHHVNERKPLPMEPYTPKRSNPRTLKNVHNARNARTRKKPSALRLQRIKLGLSAREAGKLIGVSHASVAFWETNQRNPKSPSILRLLKEYQRLRREGC